MPTTTNLDKTLDALAIQGRTDIGGTDVVDLSGAELRLAAALWAGGVVDGSFEVTPNAGMTLNIGGNRSKGDIAVVAGTNGGQGNYLVQSASGDSLTVPAADPSQARTDEVYLVVLDGSYDGGGVALPVVGYRKGDAGAGAPGPDAAWTAYLKVATISVGAGVTTITAPDITDNRVEASPFGTSTEWGDITGKPATFTPSAHEHDGAEITSGEIAAARIATLDAAKIQTGQFAAARIPTLDAAKIGTGTLDAARIPNLDAGKITSGQLALARIPTGSSGSTVALGNHSHTTYVVKTGDTMTGTLTTPAAVLTTVDGVALSHGGVAYWWEPGITPDRYWIATPNGIDFYIGPRAGGDHINLLTLRATQTILTGAVETSGALEVNGPATFPGAGTTTDNGLPGWRQLGSSDRSLNALVSSRRHKTNIADADIEAALELVDGLRPRNFTSLLEADDPDKVILGLIAEEAHEVAPQYTSDPDEDGNVDYVSYEALVMPLLVAVQDLRTRVASLEG